MESKLNSQSLILNSYFPLVRVIGIFALTAFFLVIGPKNTYALDSPGNPADFGDSACGTVHDLDIQKAPEACYTKSNLQGNRLPDVVTTREDGTQTQTTNPNVQFNGADLSTGNPLDLPTGKKDLEQWVGRTSTGEEITKDMSCDELIPKLFDVASPGDDHTGIWQRLATPMELVRSALVDRCEKIKKWYTESSLGEVFATYPDPLAENASASCQPITKSSRIALPTYGPMMAANAISRALRAPYYELSYEQALKEREEYIISHASGQTVQSASPAVAGVKTLAQVTPSPTPQPAPAPTTPPVTTATPGYLDPQRCLSGNCDTVLEKDSPLCYLNAANQPISTERTASPGTVPLKSTKYPLDIFTKDPALGGGVVTEDQTLGGVEKVLDLITSANYFFLAYTTSPTDLVLSKIWNTLRFAPGKGGDWKYENVEEEGSKWFGLGHLVALQASACRATSTPTAPDDCGVQAEVLEGAATNPKVPGRDFIPEPENETSNSAGINQPYTPGFSDPECEACTLKASSGVSQKLIDLLNEAGSAFQVPANVLLGIMRLESGHRGARPDGKAVYQYSDAEIEQAISNQDPYCVRNEYCATGPFQFLTNPNEHKDKIYYQFGGSCSLWPGNTKAGDWDIWGSFTDSAKFKSLVGHSNPNPCNLKDAAYAAAAHVRSRVEYRNAKINANSTCEDWDATSARDGWYTYQGSCENNYCTTAANFLANVCSNEAKAIPAPTPPVTPSPTPTPKTL